MIIKTPSTGSSASGNEDKRAAICVSDALKTSNTDDNSHENISSSTSSSSLASGGVTKNYRDITHFINRLCGHTITFDDICVPPASKPTQI